MKTIRERAEALVRAADLSGLSPRGASQFADVLGRVNLTFADVTSDVLSLAIRLDTSQSEALQEKVHSLNAGRRTMSAKSNERVHVGRAKPLTETKTMKTTKTQAAALLNTLGFTGAEKWASARILGRLKTLAKIVTPETDPGEHKELFDNVLAASQNGESIEVVEDAPTKKVAGKTEKTDAKPAAKKKAAKKDATPPTPSAKTAGKPETKTTATKKAAGKPDKTATKKAAGKPDKTAAKTKPSKPETNGAIGRARATILGHSASSVLKWMGTQGYGVADARVVVEALCKGGELKPSTVSTCVADGRSEKYRKGAAELTKAEAKQIKDAVHSAK